MNILECYAVYAAFHPYNSGFMTTVPKMYMHLYHTTNVFFSALPYGIFAMFCNDI